MLKVLTIEDERKVARFIQRGLQAHGMDSTIAATGDEGLTLARERAFDVITLDLTLPGTDGMTVIRQLREQRTTSAILVVSARGSLNDRLHGFDAGADDYLPKPFAFDELVARIRALGRRKASIAAATTLAYGDITMDLSTRMVRRSEEAIELTQREFALLELFLRNPEVVIGRNKIIESVWNEAFDRESNVIEVYVMYLRKKLEAMPGGVSIETVRGVGYRLTAQ